MLAHRTGYHSCCFGKLPPQLAALCQSNMAVYELGVKAALECDREAAIHAMTLDPLSAAVCSPVQIRAMAEELFEAEKEYLPFFGGSNRKTLARTLANLGTPSASQAAGSKSAKARRKRSLDACAFMWYPFSVPGRNTGPGFWVRTNYRTTIGCAENCRCVVVDVAQW